MLYLKITRDAVKVYIEESLLDITLVESEGTYLLWLDCRKMAMTDVELHCFFIEQAKVAMSPGTLFGSAGSGFMRLNIAAPRSLILMVLKSIRSAYIS